MKQVRLVAIVLLLAAPLLLESALFGAQKANNKKQQGRKALTKTQASRNHSAAMNALRNAQAAFRKHERDLEVARRKVQRKHLGASGITMANAKFKTAEAIRITIRKAVINRIKERTDYIEATVAAREAGSKLRELNNRPKMSAERKQERRAELSAIVRRPVDIELAALGEDATYERVAKEAVVAKSAAVKAHERYRRLVANDAELKSAADAVSKAREEVAAAEKKLQASNRDLQAAIRAEAQKKREAANKKKNQQNNRNKKGKKKGTNKK